MWIGRVYFATQIFLTASMETTTDSTQDECFAFDDSDVMMNVVNSTLTIQTAIESLQPYLRTDNITVGIIGGSFTYAGAPYFAAIAALKFGAKAVYIITTKRAAQNIASHSPNLKVLPILENKKISEISSVISKVDVVVLGVGLEIDKERGSLQFLVNLLNICKDQRKPLIVTDKAVHTLANNVTVLKDYPSPGVIIATDLKDLSKLKEAKINISDKTQYRDWGKYVSVLLRKGRYFSYVPNCDWNLLRYTPSRISYLNVKGEHDIMCGVLATILATILKSEICESKFKYQFIQSLASLGATQFIILCKDRAFNKYELQTHSDNILDEIDNIFHLYRWAR